MFDVCNTDSFEKVSSWLKRVSDECPKDIQVLIIGNKSDLSNKRKVTFEQGQSLAHQNNFEYLETSA